MADRQEVEGRRQKAGTLEAQTAKEPNPPVPETGGSGREAEQPAAGSDLDSLLGDATRERDEYLDLAQRTRADFENYKKRVARDAVEAEQRGTLKLARELLPVLDNLERALIAAGIDPAGEDAIEDPLAVGVRLVHRELSLTLGRAGVEPFDPTGERFDPAAHEALATRATEGAEAGVVVEVLEKGYRANGQVVRAARVVVSE